MLIKIKKRRSTFKRRPCLTWYRGAGSGREHLGTSSPNFNDTVRRATNGRNCTSFFSDNYCRTYCRISNGGNSPRSIYFKILTWLRGFLVIFLYLVWFSLGSSIFWELRDKRSLEKFAILTLKSRSHEKIEIYRTWAISSVKCKVKKVLRDYASLRNCILGPWRHGSLGSIIKCNHL